MFAKLNQLDESLVGVSVVKKMLCVSTWPALCFMHLSWVQNRIFYPQKMQPIHPFLRKVQTGNVPYNIQSAVWHTISQTKYPTKAASEISDTSVV